LIENSNQKEHEEKLVRKNEVFCNLKDHLMASVNGKISFKLKENRFSHAKDYFALRRDMEEKVILETNWSSSFDECIWLNEPLEDPKTLSDSDLVTFQLVIIQALKGYIDNHREQDPNAQRLHQIYLSLKSELVNRNLDDSGSDGFQSYLSRREKQEQENNRLEESSRTEQEEKNIQLEEARVSGSICPYCQSVNVKKNGNSFQCKNCGRYWRKKR
jgi:hypothetical protein